jgi:sigma-E processing peptidase SpoIIGA
MVVYADGVMLLNFLVDLLLILGTNRMTGHPATVGRASVAAALGGVYSGACLLPGFRFLGNLLWRIVSLATMSGIAFGCNRSGLKRGAFLALLSMAMGGIAMGFGTGRLAAVIFGGGVLFLFCLLWGGQGLPARFADMEIRFGQKVCHGTVLRDTGNLLRDPVTGQAVTVAGSRIAREMLELTPEELKDPVSLLASRQIPGLRLIPYRAVGSGGMLAAVKADEVRIDGRKVGTLVAFSPEITGRDGFEALTGGTE